MLLTVYCHLAIVDVKVVNRVRTSARRTHTYCDKMHLAKFALSFKWCDIFSRLNLTLAIGCVPTRIIREAVRLRA
jgi:hypothetical protein